MRNNDELLSAAFERSELVIKKKSSFRKRAVACVSVIAVVTAITTAVFVGRVDFREIALSNSEMVSDVISNTENSFVLKVGAEEITPNKGVSLTFKNGSSASLGGSSEDGNVKYCISSAGFICEGEGIESVTYSINKGAFAVIEAHEDSGSLITSGSMYEGDTDFPGLWSKNLNNYTPETIDTKYYTKYTLDYSSQQSDRLCINVCGEVFDEAIYNKVFDSTNTPETKAEGNTELMKGVEITCTAHYSDGTSDSVTVVIECETMTIEELGYPIAPDDDPHRKEATFVYKLK